MRLLVDLSEPLSEWVALLTDLQCDIEYIRSSVFFYDPGVDAMFLDELMDSEDPSYSDDVISYITASAVDLLRGRVDEFMEAMGYEIRRIIQVVTDSLGDTIFAIIDVTPAYEFGGCGYDYDNCSRNNGPGKTMANVS